MNAGGFWIRVDFDSIPLFVYLNQFNIIFSESTLVTRNSTDLSKKNSTLSSMLSTINQLIHFDSSTLVYALIFLLLVWLTIIQP